MRVRVDRIVPAPDVGVVLLERPRSAADAGVAEQDAHRPEVASLLARVGPALPAGYVALQAHTGVPLAPQAPHGGSRPRTRQVARNDISALPLEALRGGHTDAPP